MSGAACEWLRETEEKTTRHAIKDCATPIPCCFIIKTAVARVGHGCLASLGRIGNDG